MRLNGGSSVHTELLIVEAARLALQSYFMQMRLAGKTDTDVNNKPQIRKGKGSDSGQQEETVQKFESGEEKCIG